MRRRPLFAGIAGRLAEIEAEPDRLELGAGNTGAPG